MSETNEKALLECNDLGALAISMYKNAVPVMAMSQAMDLPNGMDFGYSQKFFHIADGNLYSIFSPLQGRTYGVKPSFLKKQKYTIEECCGRGRNSVRKGLKFHNFLPSESVTSEIEDGNREEVWKTHAECRLREEHGTKQIMISHWSVSDDGASPLTVKSRSDCSFSGEKDDKEHEPLFLTETNSQDNIFEIQSESKIPFVNKNAISTNTFLTNDTLSRNQVMIHVPSDQQKELNDEIMPMNRQGSLSVNEISYRQSGRHKLSLSDILARNGGIKESNFSYNRQNEAEQDNLTKHIQVMENSLFNNRRHRRKPTQTRRVVPYKKYLSLLEENEGIPLDLSCRSNSLTPLINHNEIHQGGDENKVNQRPSLQKTESFNLNVQNTNYVMPHCSTSAATSTTSICTSSNDPLFSPPIMKWTIADHLSNNSFLNLQKSCKVAKQSGDLGNKSSAMKYKSLANLNMKPSEVSVASRELMKKCAENTQSFSFCNDKSKLITTLSSQTKATNLNTSSLISPLLFESGKQNNNMNTCKMSTTLSQPAVIPQTYTHVTKSSVSPSAVSQTSSHITKNTDHSNSFTTDFHLPRPHRKSNQRTIIRKKLEDAFRQNGFLVKTKQVSDGEATFCKFRQLRKYTRYYLKSWHHHLPEEVHKLWKGFLPPKTTLPAISTGKKENRSSELCTKNS